MAFDLNAARQAGYSDDEIINHLAQTRNFDVAGALQAGYTKQDIMQYLTSTPAPGAGAGGPQVDENGLPLASEANITYTGPVMSSNEDPGFMHGVKEGTVDVIRGFRAMVDQNARQYGYLGGALKTYWDMAKGLILMSPESAAKLREAIRNRDFGQFLKYSPALLGGIGEGAIWAAEPMKDDHVGQAIGRSAAFIGGSVLPAKVRPVRWAKAGARSVARRAANAMVNPNDEVAAAVRWGLDEGVPVDAATATGNRAVSAAQHLSDRTIGGSLVESEARQAQARGLTAAGERLAGRVHPTAVSPEQAGTAVVSRLEQNVSAANKSADAAYGALRGIEKQNTRTVQVGTRTVDTGVLDANGRPVTHEVPITKEVGLPVDMKPVKQALRPIYKRMKERMPIAQQQASPGLKAIENILNGDDIVPASVADANLGAVKSIVRKAQSADLRDVSQGTAAFAVKRLDAAVTKAVAAGGKEAVDALKAGRAATRGKYSTAELLKQLRDEPVQVFNQATWAKDAGLERLRALQREAPQEMAKLGRAYLDDLLTKATAEGEFSRTQGIWSRWQNLGPETKKIIFGDQALVKDLDNFFLLAKKMSESPNPSGTAHVAHLAAHGALVIYHPLTGIPLQIGSNLLSRMLHNPKFVRAITSGMKTPTSTPKAAMFQHGKIMSLVNGMKNKFGKLVKDEGGFLEIGPASKKTLDSTMGLVDDGLGRPAVPERLGSNPTDLTRQKVALSFSLQKRGVPANKDLSLNAGSIWSRLLHDEGGYLKIDASDHVGKWLDKFKTDKKVRKVYSAGDIERMATGLVETAKIFGKEYMAPLIQKGLSPLRQNADPLFKMTFDLSTICPQQDVYNSVIWALEAKYGRLFDQFERFEIGRSISNAGDRPACFFCYGQAKRDLAEFSVGKAASIFRDAADLLKKNPNATAAELKEAFQGWTAIDKKKGTPSGLLKAVREYGDNPQARALMEDPVRLRDIVYRDAKPANQVEASLAEVVRTSVQGGIKPNVRKPYTAYVDQLLRVRDSVIKKFNASAGYRLNSQTDFRIWHILDLEKFLIDGKQKGAMAHAYTRQPEFIEIFGDTGIKFNISMEYAHNPKTGRIDMVRGKPTYNTMNTMPIEKIMEFRQKHPRDVGSMLVAYTEEDILVGLADPNVDMMIPYHKGAVPDAVNKVVGAKDFSKWQHEVWPKDLKKGAKIKVKLSNGKTVDVTAHEPITRAHHFNDHGLYLELCDKLGVEPRFPQYKDNPGYMKLVRDVAREPNEQVVVDPTKINWEAAQKYAAKWVEEGGDKTDAPPNPRLLRAVEIDLKRRGFLGGQKAPNAGPIELPVLR